MPTYQYSCTDCGHFLEQFQSFTEDSLTECPVCGGRLRKVFNAVGVVFKGSGFYRNDSRSADAKGAGNGASASSGSDSGSGSGSDSGSGSGSGETSAKKDTSSSTKSSDKSAGSTSKTTPSTPASSSKTS